jgi:hypothetical protein
LRARDVSGFVFWTKNLGPFLDALPEVRATERPFTVQYTINGYPRELEARVTAPHYAIDHVRYVAKRYHPQTVVWRYDTIVQTSLTNWAFHRRNFANLASSLRGSVDEVVVSFAHFYRKTEHTISVAAEEYGFWWRDPSIEEKRDLLTSLATIAGDYGMKLSLCAQPDFLVDGVEPARCIDADRLSVVGSIPLEAPIKGNRQGCECSEARDIGEYDTCPHGCVYCYAVSNADLAKERYREHDPRGELLFGRLADNEKVDDPQHTLPILGKHLG